MTGCNSDSESQGFCTYVLASSIISNLGHGRCHPMGSRSVLPPPRKRNRPLGVLPLARRTRTEDISRSNLDAVRCEIPQSRLATHHDKTWGPHGGGRRARSRVRQAGRRRSDIGLSGECFQPRTSFSTDGGTRIGFGSGVTSSRGRARQSAFRAGWCVRWRDQVGALSPLA